MPEAISIKSPINCPPAIVEKSKLVLTKIIPTKPNSTPAIFFLEKLSPSSLGLKMATHKALKLMKSAALAAVV